MAEKENGKTDWDFVHASENLIKDKPNLPMIELAKNYKEDGFEVIILTGRPESTRKTTKEWLQKYNIPYDEIYFGKPSADYYVDDKGYRLENWDDLPF
jgi:uncharacterized HAD superfamily protein